MATLSIVAQPVPLSVDQYGTVRVGGTRLMLDVIVDAFKRGDSPQEIADAFDGLALADVYTIIAYYLRNQADVEAYLLQQEEKAAAIRKKIETLQGSQDGLRERLLARPSDAEAERVERAPSRRRSLLQPPDRCRLVASASQA